MVARRLSFSVTSAVALCALAIQAATFASDVGDPGQGDWLQGVQQRIAESEYRLTWHENADGSGVWQAPNRAQGFRTFFESTGIRLEPRVDTSPPWSFGLSWGHAHDAAGELPELSVDRNRLDIGRSGAAVWFANGSRGLEIGLTLRQGSAELPFIGTLLPFVLSDGTTVELQTPGGERVLRLSGVDVRDPSGDSVPVSVSAFARDGGRGLRFTAPATRGDASSTLKMLLTGAAWVVDGTQTEAAFGYAVGTAGDVNGDGYSDVAVAAISYDIDAPNQGRIYVYHGSDSGLSLDANWTVDGDQQGAFLGHDIATAGDVNGDGFADLVAGELNYTNGQTDEGRVLVYLGSASGLAPTAAWDYESDLSTARLGEVVGTAGDVNGDGYSDIVASALSRNRVVLFHGSPNGPSPVPDWTGETTQGVFGSDVSTAGDINGDGFSDVIVGAFLFTNGITHQGRAFAYHGSASGLSNFPAWFKDGVVERQYFGQAVAGAGDLNGDGFADVIIGMRRAPSGLVVGRAQAFLGSASGLGDQAAWTVTGAQESSGFAREIGPAGDVNGDGFADIVVNAPNLQTGRAFVYHGSPEGPSTSADWIGIPDADALFFGASVMTAGDVNSDGYADLIVGAHATNAVNFAEGRAYLYLGSPAGLRDAPGWSASGGQDGDGLGLALAGAGDVDGDGRSDVIVGAPFFDNGQVDEGRALLFLGNESGLSSTAVWSVEGDQAGAHLGAAVGGGGDVNGDGFTDVIVGVPGHDDSDADNGQVRLHHGSATGPSLAADWIVNGVGADSRLGAAVACAGDVDGDGFADVLIGAPGNDGALSDAGAVHVFHGATTGLESTPRLSFEGSQSAADFGGTVGGIGDVDGDGYSDIAVGAARFDGAETDEGRVVVHLGSPDGLVSAPAWSALGGQADATFGAALGPAGDTNGDGFADLIVGAPLFDNGETDEGAAFVYLGQASGLSALPGWTAEGGQSSAHFGQAVYTAGDIDRDGFSDVAVGAPLFDNGEMDEGAAFVYRGTAAGPAAAPSQVLEGNEIGFHAGTTVASAGDATGDGYADLLVGSPGGLSSAGTVQLFQGNEGPGLELLAQQRRFDDGAPVAPLGASDIADGFRLQLFGRSPFGRGLVKLEWEVKPLGTPFDGTATGRSAAWLDSQVAGATINELIEGLEPGTPLHWRVRVLYHPATTPYVPYGRWVSGSWNGWQETDLRTAAPPLCGDGQVAAAEGCDDGNTFDGDGCDADCIVETCGNAVAQAGEECDDGNDINDDACANDCVANVCGDAAVNNGEECDDGNLADGDGCETDCSESIRLMVHPGSSAEAVLLAWTGGQPIYEIFRSEDAATVAAPENRLGETAEVQEFPDTPPAGTLFYYKVLRRCGNGVLDPGEACDDGNLLGLDGCRADCTAEICGDGILDPGEQCDDQNNVDGDGCQSDCSDPICGDVIVDSGEQCDDGNSFPGDGCRADCTAEICGDGILDPFEHCDDGNDVDGDGCQSDCLIPRCGDGTLDPGEQCDDGNNLNFDGCSAACETVEVCDLASFGPPLSGGTATDADPAYCYLYRVTVTCDGVSTGAAGKLRDINLAGRRAMFVLYDDDGPEGEPQTLLGYTDAFFDTGSGGTPLAVNQPWAMALAVTAGDYWLGVCSEKTFLDYYVVSPSGVDNREDSMGDWLFGPPNPWRHGTDTPTTEGDLLLQIQVVGGV